MSWRMTGASSIYLDILRVVLAQLVVIGHAASFYHVLPWVLPPYFPNVQSVAVQMFFVLSGFLICYSTLAKTQKSTYPFRHFFIDRFSRIYSAFIPAILFVVICDGIFKWVYPSLYAFHDVYSINAFLQNIAMLHKTAMGYFVGGKMFGTGSPWWSLSTEWWLYMAFGWAVLGKGRLYWPILIFLSIDPAAKAIFSIGANVGLGASVIWLAGAMLYFPMSYVGKSDLSKWRFSALAIMAFGLACLRYYLTQDAYDVLAAMVLIIGFGASVAFFEKLNWKPSNKVIFSTELLAGYSFTLFLIHYTIMEPFYRLGFKGWGVFFFSVILSNIAAFILAKYTERRYRELATWLRRKTDKVSNE